MDERPPELRGDPSLSVVKEFARAVERRLEGLERRLGKLERLHMEEIAEDYRKQDRFVGWR